MSRNVIENNFLVKISSHKPYCSGLAQYGHTYSQWSLPRPAWQALLESCGLSSYTHTRGLGMLLGYEYSGQQEE